MLEALIERRANFLVNYQNAAYAQRYRDFIATVQGAEASTGKTRLSEAVARNLFKLMAYKDEYEVARLHSDPAFQQRLRDQFEGDFQLKFHLAPPLLAATNDQGELIKQTYGSWMLGVFGWLARFKGLRGTALDIFGNTEERRTERALIQEYRASIDAILARGLLRLRARQSTHLSTDGGESFVDFSAHQSGHAEPTKRRQA